MKTLTLTLIGLLTLTGTARAQAGDQPGQPILKGLPYIVLDDDPALKQVLAEIGYVTTDQDMPLLAATLVAQPVRQPSLRIPLLVYAATAALDLHSTHRFMSLGIYQEANPIARGLSRQPNLMVISGVIADASAVYAMHQLLGERMGRRTERIVIYSLAAVRAAFAVKNYRLAAAGMPTGASGCRPVPQPCH